MPDPKGFPYFDYEPNEMIEYLYRKSMKLSARVETLSDILAYMLKQQGYKSTDIDKLVGDVDEHFFNDNLSEDIMLEKSWKKRLENELGDVPGLEIK